MVVCKFFLQGNCRFGANCRNEHPAGQGGNQGGGGGGGFGNQNRFGALSNTGNNRFGGSNDNLKQYTLNPADIKLDLTRGQGRPQWVLSTYGAGRGTPASLFEGNEFSPEEIRLRFYEMASKGQEAQADQEAIQLWTKAEQDLNNAASHVDDISKFMEEAEKKHPNRYDFVTADGTKTREELIKSFEEQNASSSGFGNSSGFGQSSNSSNPFAKPAAATFGQPSAPSAFGASSFGSPAQPSGFGQPAFGQSGFGGSTPAFGQQSSPFSQSSSAGAFGQPAAASAFGKPAFGASGFGQSGFGQPAQPQTVSAFGQPAQQSNQSPFGQSSSNSAFGQSGFGQQSKPNPFAAPSASSGFGASANTFGQSTQPASAFGQSPQQAPGFGQPSQPSPGFGQSAFGQPAQANAFGKPAFGQPAGNATSSPFGQTANTSSGFGFGNKTDTSGFGQSTQQNASPFGQVSEPRIAEVSMDGEAPPNATAQAQQPANPFGTPQSPFAAQPAQQMPAATASPLASAQPMNQAPTASSPLTSKPQKPLHYTQTLPQIPPQTNMTKRLISYRGQQVQYLGDDGNEVPCYNRPDGKGPEKIWFTEAGATQEVATLNREEKLADLQVSLDEYTEQVKAEYAYLFEEGKFKDGKIPLVPPLREWCVYDF